LTAEFADVYEHHVGRIFGFFSCRLDTRETAEDLTQQTFERALRAWSRFDPRQAGEATWLTAIARNLLIDHMRRSSLGVLRESLFAATIAGVAANVADDIDARVGIDPKLEAALARLSDRERVVLDLRFGGDLPGSEIADLVGVTVDNVHQILSRALHKLRADLELAEIVPDATLEGRTV
jgi:RNA polymerase sigma-70 factor (ECF subfamily)